MADSDKTLQIQIILDLIGAGKTEEARQKLAELKETTAATGQASEATGEQVKSMGKEVDSAGDHANTSHAKHVALRHVLGQLNEVIPGLGESMHLLAESYFQAGEAADGAAVGTAGFTTALDAMLVSVGPLIIGILGIEATFKYWDMYKTKVEAAATAQEDATKRIVESTHQALKAVQDLDKAMNQPKHDTAEKDDAYLKNQQQNLENAYNRQHDLNKANEDKELKGAGSQEEKDAIQQRYAVLDAALSDWRAKQQAAIEGAMVGTMDKQIAQIKKAEDDLVKEQSKQFQTQKDAQAQIDSLTAQRDAATKTVMGPNGISVTTADTERQAALDIQIKAQQGALDAAKKEYADVTGKINKLKEDAGPLGEKRAELAGQQSSDAGNAAFNAETNRQKFGVSGIDYQPPNAGYTYPSQDPSLNDATNKFTTGKSIADAATRGEKVSPEQMEYLRTLEQTITGQKLTFEQSRKLIEMQSANQEYSTNLIEAAHTKIEVMHARLQNLESRFGDTQRQIKSMPHHAY